MVDYLYYVFIFGVGCGLYSLFRWLIGEERFNFTYIIKWVDSKLVKRSWRYNMTDTQKWWAGVVEKGLAEKGLEIDDDGHVRRKGDGIQ